MTRADIGWMAIGLAGVAAWALIGFGHTLGRSDYDPNEVAKDGPFRAPRKWLHVQKILIGCTVYACTWAVFVGLDWTPFGDYGQAAAMCALSGPLLFSQLREMIAPTDPDRHTFLEHFLDTMTDGALYAVPQILELITAGRWIAAVVLAIMLASIYRVCRNGARP